MLLLEGVVVVVVACAFFESVYLGNGKLKAWGLDGGHGGRVGVGSGVVSAVIRRRGWREVSVGGCGLVNMRRGGMPSAVLLVL